MIAETAAICKAEVAASHGLSLFGERRSHNRLAYRLDLLSATDNSNVTTYFLQDGLGSTTGLTDDDGVVTDTYGYDVFGAMKSHSGTSANPWKFTGELNDSTVGRSPYYLRARYYDLALGRFLSRDPFAGHLTSPQTQNRYAYVSNSCPLGSVPEEQTRGDCGQRASIPM
jgi:RHS repeat-associated protein